MASPEPAPLRFAQLKYGAPLALDAPCDAFHTQVIFSWRNTPLLKRDGLARDFFQSHATMTTLARSLDSAGGSGFPLTLYEAALPGTAPELWLDEAQCRQLIALLARSMGPSRAASSWKPAAYHSRAALERSGYPLRQRTFTSQADLERHFGHLKDHDDWLATRTHWRELKRAQQVYAHFSAAAAAPSPAFVAVDVETWEQDHDLVTEVGVAKLAFSHAADGPTTTTSCEHLVLAENAHRRNGRYCPDARDDFQLGQSDTLPRVEVAHRLESHLRLGATPAPAPVFLLLHDPRGDVRSLTSLGLDLNQLERAPLLPDPATPAGARALSDEMAGAGFLLDTQRLYSGYSRRRRQVRLEDAVRALGVVLPPTAAHPAGGRELAFHNSGNDAWATLQVFVRLMHAPIGDNPDEVVPPGWTPGGRPVPPSASNS